MPIQKVKGGYKWGNQKLWSTKKQAQQQAAAIYASGYKADKNRHYKKGKLGGT